MSSLKSTGSTGQWRKLRKRILQRDNYTCQLCGDNEPANMTVDHIVPRRLMNGKAADNPENLQTLCKRCNFSKGGTFFERALTPPTPLSSFCPENETKRHYLA